MIRSTPPPPPFAASPLPSVLRPPVPPCYFGGCQMSAKLQTFPAFFKLIPGFSKRRRILLWLVLCIEVLASCFECASYYFFFISFSHLVYKIHIDIVYFLFGRVSLPLHTFIFLTYHVSITVINSCILSLSINA